MGKQPNPQLNAVRANRPPVSGRVGVIRDTIVSGLRRKPREDIHMSEVSRLIDVYRQYDNAPKGQNRGYEEILSERNRRLHDLIQSLVPSSKRSSTRVLDIGCGSGEVLSKVENWGFPQEQLFGVDLMAWRVEQGRKRYPRMNLICGNAEKLSFSDGYFDLVLLMTVFSSILDGRMAERVAGEAVRVLRQGGHIIWYDFRVNNPWNLKVRGVGRKAITGLFPSMICRLNSVTLIPQIARRLGCLAPVVYPVLGALPLLRTHLLGSITKA